MPWDLSPLCQAAWARFDERNAQDPNSLLWEGVAAPRELFYARHLSAWVERLAPAASEPLQLASRCQHLCRWVIPRTEYEATRTGYLRWRAELKKFHAGQVAEILAGLGYDEETRARVRSLNLKEALGCDPEVQVLEDALCLLTLQYQLGELREKTGEEKLVEILRKTWRKMSPAGHEAALGLSYSAAEQALLQAALAPPATPPAPAPIPTDP